MKKRILYGSLGAIAVVIFLWFFAPLQKPPEKNVSIPDWGWLHPPPVSDATGRAPLQGPPPSAGEPGTSVEQVRLESGSTPSPPAETAPYADIRVTLAVGPSLYQASAGPAATIHDVMTALAKTSSLTFQTRYYAGLGYLVEAINGVRSQNGFYWKLYVNGEYAEVGVSQYKLTDGDAIVWKYEKE